MISYLEYISWGFTAISLYGTWLNANQKRAGFMYWLIADIFFATVNLYYHFWAQGFLFIIFSILAIMGLCKWKK